MVPKPRRNVTTLKKGHNLLHSLLVAARGEPQLRPTSSLDSPRQRAITAQPANTKDQRCQSFPSGLPSSGSLIAWDPAEDSSLVKTGPAFPGLCFRLRPSGAYKLLSSTEIQRLFTGLIPVYTYTFPQNRTWGMGTLERWFSSRSHALLHLVKNLSSVPSTHIRWLPIICNSSSRHPTPSSGLHRHCMHVVH